MFEFHVVDILGLECPLCKGGTVIPIQFLDEYKKKKSQIG